MFIRLHINYYKIFQVLKKSDPIAGGHWGHIAPNLSKKTNIVFDRDGSMMQLFISRLYLFSLE